MSLKMTSTTICSTSSLDRRAFVAGLATLPILAPGAAAALTAREADALVQRVVGDINTVINSGKSENSMYRDFERIFRRYADLGGIAQIVLGPTRRQMSSAQLRSFVDAFTVYMSRKYGKRFREFIGGTIEVVRTRDRKRWIEVDTITRLRGSSPFEVVFKVSSRTGKNLFFDIVIEGISLGKTERTEIQSMYDRSGRNVDGMIQQLRRST